MYAAAVPSDEPHQTQSVRASRLALGLLLTINLLNYIDRQVLAAVEPLIAKDIITPGDPLEQTKMGRLPMAFMASYMISAPIFGWMGDRWKRWPIIGIGVFLFTIASGLSGLSPQKAAWLSSLGLGTLSAYAAMFITRMFVGIGEGAYGPVAPTIISDLFPVERRGSVMAWFYMAIPVGSALGYILGGLIGGRFGWPWAFYAVVPPGVLLAVLCFFMPEPRRLVASAAKQKAFDAANYKRLLKTPSYVCNVVGMTAMTFAVGGVSFWMPRYVAVFRNVGGVENLEKVNLIFGVIVVIAGIAATLAGGWLGDRLRTRVKGAYLFVSAMGMFAGFPLFVAMLFVPFPACWVVIFLAVFCLFFNTGPSNTAIANVTRPAVRASAFALCIFTIHALGDVISPSIIGQVSDAAGGNMNVGFAVVSGMVLVAGAAWMIGSRFLDRDTQKVASDV